MSQVSREKILRGLRDCVVPPVALPDTEVDAIRYDHPRAQFEQLVTDVGGSVIQVPAGTSPGTTLQQLDVYQHASRIASVCPEVPSRGIDLASIDDPHGLADVDLCIAAGAFGVAENGAIWVTDRGMRHRALLFLAQHLALIVPADQIVHHMHEAYARLTLGAGEFGVFISGPSKTADIEQSLVIGAHGARSLTVLLTAKARC